MNAIGGTVIGRSIAPPTAEVRNAESPLGRAWDDLALASRNVFVTREWIWTWWQHYGAGQELRVAVLRDSNGDPFGIVPLYLTRKSSFRLLRFVGHGAADEVGPVSRPEDQTRVGEALRDWLRSTPFQWDVLLAEWSPDDEVWSSRLDARVLHATSSPTIHFEDGSWDGYLATLTRKLRRQIRQDERRLSRKHRVAYRMTTDRSDLDADLDTFFDLHRRRWRDGSSLLAREAFYRQFAALAFTQGWLRLSFLELDDRPVAARFDLCYGGVQFAYNAGRDPNLGRESVGLVLRSWTMREALAQGVREYRFLRGGEEYKHRFATVDRQVRTLVVPGSARARVVTPIVSALVRHPVGRAVARGVIGR